MKRALGPLVVSLTLSFAGVAAAQSAEDLESAKTYYNAGAQAFSAGQFSVAVQAFAESYKLAPKPAILFSMAQAERRQFYVDGRPDTLKSAIAHYKEYLAQVSSGGRRADAAQALGELEQRLATLGTTAVAPPPPPPVETRLMVSTPVKNASVWIDGTRAAELPLIEQVAPGKHKVKVSAPGYFDDEREIVAVKGGLVAIDVALKERPARLFVAAPPGADVLIDGRPQGTLPLGALDLPAGTHHLAITLNGHVAHSEELELGNGEDREVRTGLRKTGQRKASYWMMTAGAVGIGLGGAFTLMAYKRQGEANDVLDKQARTNITDREIRDYEKARDSRDRWRNASYGAFGAGVGLGVVGILMYAFDQPVVSQAPATKKKKDDEKKKPEGLEVSVLPVTAPGVLGIGAAGSF